ncbi:MAG: response regulator transcription factor [Verrucomicrobia bacterium]|nr:response regulator transcription factor [Verrucomicrobiota bacterium]MBU4291247.1 response regulator transcription factor [Verrucomicrobiota bacterium]MBU4429885.1 response regulator transcription factor [Verrucomicrobiota bacterium]MCG2678698.1 response regulator transcription factor [Kiritimatiellia bacterium]
MKILIAEDDLTSQLILKANLTHAGYEPVVTGDGRAAYELLIKPDAPKLAILDWMMPGLDGVEICRKVRELKSDQPAYLILLTVRTHKDDIIRGLQAGANDYIVKPYDVDELDVRIGVGRRVVELQASLAGRIIELQDALAQIKSLRGLLPICMYCKKIRNDKQYWQQVEGYISEHSEAQFSHGICPDCLKTYIQPELDKITK